MSERITTEDLGMQSHPNYKGYDATAGKPDKRPEKTDTRLSAHIGNMKRADLYCDVPEAWMPKINAVREWCESQNIDFCPSPFPYQIAKVMADDFTIVLWASKQKKTRSRFIKCAFEGPALGQSDYAMTAIKGLVS